MLLPDPEDLLRGEGSYVRFVTVREHHHLHAPALCQLIAAASHLPRRRADRIALADSLASQGRPNTPEVEAVLLSWS